MQLMRKFNISNLCKLQFYLDVKFITTNKDLFLTQWSYKESILVEFVIIDSNLIFVPTPKGLKLKKNEESPLINTTYYQKFIDKMIYLLNLRLDLLYATWLLSQFMHSSWQAHLQVVKYVLRYIKNILNFEILYQKTKSEKIQRNINFN